MAAERIEDFNKQQFISATMVSGLQRSFMKVKTMAETAIMQRNFFKIATKAKNTKLKDKTSLVFFYLNY